MSKKQVDSPEVVQRFKRFCGNLAIKTDSHHLQLHGRLMRCGGPDWGYRFTCRSPACPHCRDRYIARQRRDVQKRFGDADNSRLALVTIVLGATQDIWEVGRLYEKGRRDLRNAINRARRAAAPWKSFEFVGWLEVDAYDPTDLSILGSDKNTQLREMLQEIDASTGPIWTPTMHAIVRLPDSLDLDQVRSAFGRQWPHHRQVDVSPFYAKFSVGKNICNIMNYVNKHSCETGPADLRVAWDDSWVVRFYTWMDKFSRGFHSLRTVVSAVSINDFDTDYKTEETPTASCILEEDAVDAKLLEKEVADIGCLIKERSSRGDAGLLNQPPQLCGGRNLVVCGLSASDWRKS